MKQIAWIGTGVMGGQQAGHLAKKGYPVKAYNRSADKLEALKKTKEIRIRMKVKSMRKALWPTLFSLRPRE